MPFAISITSTNETAQPLYDLWARLGPLEDTPSMAALNYPPHITLAIYEDIEIEALVRALRRTFARRESVLVTFDRLKQFDTPEFVVWAAPLERIEIRSLHETVHSCLDSRLCHPQYRPGAWIPHCTIATQIRRDKRDEALALIKAPMEPFEVRFDRADCISFMPVRVIEEHVLI